MDEYYGNYFRPSYGGYDDRPSAIGFDNPWQTIISQGIEAARDVARGATSDWPYTSPDDPHARRPIDVDVYPAPLPAPLPPGTTPRQPGGITLSTNTLMLLVGGFLLFTLGQRKGR